MRKRVAILMLVALAVAGAGCEPRDAPRGSAAAELPREWRVFQGVADHLPLPEAAGGGARLVEAPAFVRLDPAGALRLEPGARMPIGGHRVILELDGERVELRVHVQPVV